MPNTKKWYSINASAPVNGAAGNDVPSSATIYIYGDIGESWSENSVIAADLVQEIAALDVAQIDVRINSFGGSVPDALAIYNALERHPAVINTYVDGVALSCGSYIAMAGDTRVVAENGLLMIHAPWSLAMGNAADLRTQADVLDKFALAMSPAYAKAASQSIDSVISGLLEGSDHWYTAEEALAEGFATDVGASVDVSACLATFQNLQNSPRDVMSRVYAHFGRPQFEKQTPPLLQEAPAMTQAALPVRSTEDNQNIDALFKPFSSRDGVAALEKEILMNTTITVAEAQSKLLVLLGKDVSSAAPSGAFPKIETLADERDMIISASAEAIMSRGSVLPKARAENISANPYRGMKLLDHARASLQRAGVKTDEMTQVQLVAAAFTQSTSDFPVLLENVMHKTLQSAYAVAPTTWQRFCATGSVSDFRAHSRYRTGGLSNLDSVSELGEFKNKTISDGEKSSITAVTKGNIINLSRQTIINDDLGALTGLAQKLGFAASRTVEAAVYALLAENSGLGTTMDDGHPLFYARSGNDNVAATGAISMAVFESIRTKMKSQLGVGSVDYLDIAPSILVCPAASFGTANSINQSKYDPDTANKLQKPNSVLGMFSDIVDTARLSGTRVYAFADPMLVPTIEVAFLDGQQAPYLEMQNGFGVDGVSWKVRLDYAVAAIDYRGAVTAAGA